MAVALSIIGTFGIATLALWTYALRDCARTKVFSGGSKTVWFVIIFFGPVAGSVAYLTVRRSVERFSQRDPDRLARLMAKGG